MSAPSCIAVYAPRRHAIVIVDRSGAAVTVPADEAPLLAQAILDALAIPAQARQMASPPPSTQARAANETPAQWRDRTRPMFDALYGSEPTCGRCGQQVA